MFIHTHERTYTNPNLNPYFNRFFHIGTGYESTADFLAEARCGHTYADKFVKTITDVKEHAPVRDKDKKPRPVTDNTSAPGVLHAPTRDRLPLKKEKKDHRSELYSPNTNTRH